MVGPHLVVTTAHRPRGAPRLAAAVTIAVVLTLVHVVVATVGFPTPALAAVTMDVTPNVALIDGQVVTASFTGVSDGWFVGVQQCFGTPLR